MKPIVILPACVQKIGLHEQHTVQVKYVNALVAAGCTPLILPALGEVADIEAVLGACHGVMLTGSPSNVHPRHYGEPMQDARLRLDAARDATTLPLIRAVLARGMPLLGICRGFQEINVAMGGTLHQAVHAVTGMRDHREDKQAGLDQQYAAAHAVTLAPGGRLAQILGHDGELQVNSLHGQGVDRLAPGLVVEARAADGLVEAFSDSAATGFALALQWHPEWRLTENPDSLRIFGAFAKACRIYQGEHNVA
ncbi:MAG: gamma-glutamyl-gamma-aminobutyrate hydrolase family protein [Pseudomonadota bacterium]